MNKLQKKKPKHVFKHSAATQIATSTTLLQRKAFNALLANAYNELPDSKVKFHRINLKDLCLLLEYNSNDVEYLKKVLVQIRKTDVEYNVLHKDHVEWGNMGLLSEVKMKVSGLTGEVHYSFPETLRKKLYNPAMYIRLNLTLQNRFHSKYTLILYELCLDYLNIKKRFGETPWIELDKLKAVLGLSVDEYPEYKDLNRYCIKKPIKEINNVSNIFIEVANKRKGRKVNWLKFHIKFNKKNMEKEAFLPPKFHEEKQLSLLDNISQNVLEKELINDFGVSKGAAKKLVKEYKGAYIEECLETIGDQIKLNVEIKNLGGFTRTFIENNYTTKPPEIIERAKVLKKENARQKEEKRRQEEEERIKQLEEIDRQDALIESLKKNDPIGYSDLKRITQEKMPQRMRSREGLVKVHMRFHVDEFLNSSGKSAWHSSLLLLDGPPPRML